MAEEQKIYTYRHKTVRRFATAGFEFQNFILRIKGDEENERFLKVLEELPERDRVGISRYNEEAAAQLDIDPLEEARRQAELADAESRKQPTGDSTIRGATSAADIATQKDAAAAAASGTTQSGSAGTSFAALAAAAAAGKTN